MRRRLLFLIVGIVISLLVGSLSWNRTDWGMDDAEFTVQTGASAATFNPVGEEIPLDTGVDKVGIAPSTYTHATNVGRSFRPQPSLRQPYAFRQQVKHVARFVQRCVSITLLSHHVSYGIGWGVPSSLYIYAIRHIII